MEVKLMNFGDATRVVHNIDNKPVMLRIGQSRRVQLHDRMVAMIRRNMEKGDTMLIVPEGVEPPEKLKRICELQAVVGDMPYADLLAKVIETLGHDPHNPRPNVAQIRDRLTEEARIYCRAATQQLLDRAPQESDDDEEIKRDARGSSEDRSGDDGERGEHADANQSAAPAPDADQANVTPRKRKPRPAKKTARTTRVRTT